MVHFTISRVPLERSGSSRLVILLAEDADGIELRKGLSSTLRREANAWVKVSGFVPSSGANTLFPASVGGKTRQVLLAGLGRFGDGEAHLFKACAKLGRRLSNLGWKDAAIDVSSLVGHRIAPTAFGGGLVGGAYAFDHFKRSRDPRGRRLDVTLHGVPSSQAGHDFTGQLDRAMRAGQAMNEVRDLANHPGNLCTPEVVATSAAKLARKHGLRVRVLDPRHLRAERCNAMLAVGQGSAHGARLVYLEHKGSDPKARPIILVGKTITFDSGGISIKPAKNMEWMRYDKSGGMAVLATLAAAATLRLPHRIVGILAAAENMPGGGATRPGDVVRSRNGTTIEIINTDAEGRLVLADALSLAQDMDPKALVDLATLTGAAVTALGSVMSAVMGTSQPMLDALIKAGSRTGELLWPLPLHPSYRDMLNTPFADIRNTGDGSAGAIAGGMFLKEFVSPAYPWAHIDLTHAWEERDQAHAAAGANLFGARLLINWLENHP